MLTRATPNSVNGALLVVSELVSNAIIHARGPGVLLAWPHDHALRVEVTDRAPDQTPAPRTVPPGSRNGRGLGLVGMISEKWGFTVNRALATKTVWADVRLEPLDGS